MRNPELTVEEAVIKRIYKLRWDGQFQGELAKLVND